jgi:isoleucyl-tRNA synthetase
VDGRRVVDGEPLVVAGVELLPDEVEVRTKDRPGLAVATEDGLTVAVDTTLTPELVLEGHARELVHRIQTMRKAADYQIEEKIVTYYDGGPTLDKVVATFGDYVKQETLTRALRAGVPRTVDHAEEFSIDGEKARIAVARE